MSPIHVHKYVRKRWNSHALIASREAARELAKKQADERKRQALRDAGVSEEVIQRSVLS